MKGQDVLDDFSARAHNFYGLPYEPSYAPQEAQGGTSGFSVDDFVAPDILSPRRPDNSARIEQITRRLAEIREEKKALDPEREMAEYKYLYEADPSAYMNLMHNRKTAEQTEQIRKGSEEATRQANLQSAYKENSNGLMVAQYDLAEARNQLQAAYADGSDPNAIARARNAYNRAEANYNRLARENEVLRGRVMKSLGMAEEKPVEAPEAQQGADEEHLKAVSGANAYQEAKGILDTMQEIKADNMNISKAEKKRNIDEMTAKLARARELYNSGKFGPQAKAEMDKLISAAEEKIRNYGKPVGKGGQGVNKTVEDYQKALDGMTNSIQAARMGKAWLDNAEKSGAKPKGFTFDEARKFAAIGSK
jgi:hypothetical protein